MQEDVGLHCSLRGCGQLDFLPFVCGHCSEVFCSAHRLEHGCPHAPLFQDGIQSKSSLLTVCRRCRSTVAVCCGSTPERALEEHQSSNQCDVSKKQFCGLYGCSTSHAVFVKCSGCAKAFCLAHRHPNSHSCSSIEVEDAEASKRQATAKKTKAAAVSARQAAVTREEAVAAGARTKDKVAMKLNAMKVRMRATGEPGILQQDRLAVRLFTEKRLDAKGPEGVDRTSAARGSVWHRTLKVRLPRSSSMVRAEKESSGSTGDTPHLSDRIAEDDASGGDVGQEGCDVEATVVREYDMFCVWLDKGKTVGWNQDRMCGWLRVSPSVERSARFVCGEYEVTRRPTGPSEETVGALGERKCLAMDALMGAVVSEGEDLHFEVV